MGVVIKAIIFDLGRVIVPFDFRRGYARMEALCGIPAAEIPGRIAPTGLVRRFESGQIEPRDFVAQLSAHLNLNASYEDFCEIWSSVFLPETLIPEDLLRSLGRRYRLILLSNTNAIHFEMIRAHYPLLRHFHSFVLSYEVGAINPLRSFIKGPSPRRGAGPTNVSLRTTSPNMWKAPAARGSTPSSSSPTPRLNRS